MKTRASGTPTSRQLFLSRAFVFSWPGLVLLMAGFVFTSPGSISGQQEQPPVAPVSDLSPRAVLNQYCVTCHSDAAKTGGLTLARLDLDHPAADAEIWEKVIKKLRAGLMPPTGARRPDRATLEGLRRTIETSIDRTASSNG